MTDTAPTPDRLPTRAEQSELLVFIEQQVRLYEHRLRLEARQLYATDKILGALKRSRRSLRAHLTRARRSSIPRHATAIPSTISPTATRSAK
jgi:hypothetical protein